MTTDVASVRTALIHRFFHGLWNRWELAVADEILAEDLRFRGSLGSTLQGRDAFKGYVRTVRTAFPDWHNRIDELIVGDDAVAARMTYSGTHRGPLSGVEATGNRVTYVGVAIFRFAGGRISEGWVVGDTQELWRALGVLTTP